MATFTLPDGTRLDLPEGATGTDVATAIGPGLARAALAVSVDGDEYDLAPVLPPGKVNIITGDSEAGREILRHSTAHILAQAVTDLYPDAKYTIGPAVEDGFYYDFEVAQPFTETDLDRIEARMREIVDADQAFVRHEVSRDEATALFADQPYKVEIIDSVDTGEVAEGNVISVYENEGWNDLCRGPHVPSTGHLGDFKLMRTAGAYWRGDETKAQLQRIYGTAWESKKALKSYLHRLEEARKRDHRRIGTDLDLFSFPEEIGSGLAVWHPKGALVRKLMEDFSRAEHERSGYQFVVSPHVAKSDLFEISGHLGWYRENMYPEMQLEGASYFLKPMNCPFHVLIFRSRTRSYRELPLRMFEIGTVYRYERSGVIHGLTRVRGLTQDDAHIFCTPDQLVPELESLVAFVLRILRRFGLDDFHATLSTRPEKFVGKIEEWDEATAALEQALRTAGLPYEIDPGGGVLRPQDRHQGQGRDRPPVAAVHTAGGLPAAAALRPPFRGRRQRRAPAVHDPPGAVRLDRALLRDPPRALRRRPTGVAVAGAGGGRARRRPAPAPLPRDRGRAARRGVPGFGQRRRREPRCQAAQRRDSSASRSR